MTLAVQTFSVARDTPKIPLPVPVLSVIACLQQLKRKKALDLF
jgi:hypothetical protein